MAKVYPVLVQDGCAVASADFVKPSVLCGLKAIRRPSKTCQGIPKPKVMRSNRIGGILKSFIHKDLRQRELDTHEVSLSGYPEWIPGKRKKPSLGTLDLEAWA